MKKKTGRNRGFVNSYKEGFDMSKLKHYRIDQVAEFIQKSPRTVRRLIEDGKLEAHNPNPGKQGIRIPAESLEKYLNLYKIPAEKWSE